MFKLIVFVSLMFTHLSADVFPLKYKYSPTDFVKIPVIDNRALKKMIFETHALDEFEKIIKQFDSKNLTSLFDSVLLDISWRMPGIGAFIPYNAEGPQQVYTARKRQPDFDTRIFRSKNLLARLRTEHTQEINGSHTERQLVKKLLEPEQENVNGVLLIYTEGSPCQLPCEDNNYFSCIDYYNALANEYPNVLFHIYFKHGLLQFPISGEHYNKLVDFIREKLLSITLTIEGTREIIPNPYFREEQGKLQFCQNPENPQKRWRNVPEATGNDIKQVIQKTQAWINSIKTEIQGRGIRLDKTDMQKLIISKQIGWLFTHVFSEKSNVIYHHIDPRERL
jgi:hypothetical protein